jgi:hypothetical protein
MKKDFYTLHQTLILRNVGKIFAQYLLKSYAKTCKQKNLNL